MRKYISAIFWGLLLFFAGFTAALKGYGYFLVYTQASIIFVIVVWLGLTMLRKMQFTPSRYLASCVIVLLLGITGVTIGSWVLVFEKKEICAECDKVISMLEKYKEKNGSYPEKIDDIYINMPDGVTIQQEEFLSSGIDVGNIDNSDATIYLASNEYLCLVPVTKRLPMSFTRFYVFEKSNHTNSWKYKKIIWFFGINQ